jgi:hypothetical protein
MNNEWLDRLAKLLEENNAQHNTAAALREAPTNAPTRCKDIETEKTETAQNLTAKTPDGGKKQLQDCQNPAAKTAKTTNEAEDKAFRLGLVAAWSMEFGYVSMHDSITGEWHDVPTKEAPDWAKREAARRKRLYKADNRRAYRLTSAEMENVWEEEQAEMWDEPHRPADARKGLVYDDAPEEEDDDSDAPL